MTDETDSREEISDMGDVSRHTYNMSNTIQKIKVINQEAISIEDPYSQYSIGISNPSSINVVA